MGISLYRQKNCASLNKGALIISCLPLMGLFQGSEDCSSHHQVQNHQKKDCCHRLPFHHCGNHLEQFSSLVIPRTQRNSSESLIRPKGRSRRVFAASRAPCKKKIQVKTFNFKFGLPSFFSYLTLLPGCQCYWLCGEGEAGLGVVSGGFRVQ